MHDRRRFLSLSLKGAAGAAIGAGLSRFAGAQTAATAKRPNVFFIAIDD